MFSKWCLCNAAERTIISCLLRDAEVVVIQSVNSSLQHWTSSGTHAASSVLWVCMYIISRVSFSSLWKWVVLPQALKKMGNATPYANKKWVACSDNITVFNNREIHTTCITMNRCGHLYTKILYNKHWIEHIEYKWVITHSHSLTQDFF